MQLADVNSQADVGICPKYGTRQLQLKQQNISCSLSLNTSTILY